jgi:hypothetical protein
MIGDDAENVLLFPDGANRAHAPRPDAGTQALAALVALVRGAVELGKLAMVLAAVMLAGYGLAALLGVTR